MNVLENHGLLSSYKARLGLRTSNVCTVNTYTISCKLQRLLEAKLVNVFLSFFDRSVLISKQINRLKTVDELELGIELAESLSDQDLFDLMKAKQYVPQVREKVEAAHKERTEALNDLNSLDPNEFKELEAYVMPYTDEDDE